MATLGKGNKLKRLFGSATLLLALAFMPAAHGQWYRWEFGPTDAQLEIVTRTAYSGAARYAFAHKNYFSRDDEFEGLRDSILAELARNGLADVSVPAEPLADLDAARSCLKGGGIELRIVTTIFGDGVSLAAASERRVFTYAYDPRESAKVVVTPAEDCRR